MDIVSSSVLQVAVSDAVDLPYRSKAFIFALGCTYNIFIPNIVA